MSAPAINWIDKFFGPGDFRPDTQPVLPTRGLLRIIPPTGTDPGDVVYDDEVHAETVLDLSALTGGGGSSGPAERVNFSGTVLVGDAVVSALDNTDPTKVKQALPTPKSAAGTIAGVVFSIDVGGASGIIALPGAKLATTITSLTTNPVPTDVVANGSARCVRNTAPSFHDSVVGRADTQGILHVLPNRSRVGEFRFNVKDFGATGLVADDATPAFEAAIAAVKAAVSVDDSSYPQIPAVYFDQVCKITKPLRIDKTKMELCGSAAEKAWLVPHFKGPCIIASPNFSEGSDVAVLTGGPLSGNRFYADSASKHFFDITQLHCAEINGFTAATFECWVRLETAMTGSNFCAILQSSGLTAQTRDTAGNVTAVSLYVLGGGIFSTSDNVVEAGITVAGTRHTIVSDNAYALVLNTWTHIALDWDGDKFRLLVNGHVAHSQSGVSGTLTQKRWENLFLGNGMQGHQRNASVGNFRGSIGPVRFSNVSNYSAAIGGGSTYTIPTAPFSTDIGVRGFQDIFVCNWDQTIYGDVYGATYAATDQVWMVSGSGVGEFSAVDGIKMHDFAMVGNGGVSQVGGIYLSGVTDAKLDRITGTLVKWTVGAYNLSYESRFNRIHHNDNGGSYPGLIDITSAGDTWTDCNSHIASYPYFMVGGVSLTNCTVGTWLLSGMMLLSGVFSLKNLFVDAESQNDATSLGAIACGDSVLFVNGGIIAQGGLADFPTFTLDKVDADLYGMTSTGAAQVTCQISTPRPPPHRILYGMIDTADTPPSALTPTPVTNDPTSKIIVVDRNVSGRIAFTYPSDADLTVSAERFTYRTLEVGNGSLASNKNLILPLLAGLRRTVVNNTSHTITVKGPTGTGPTLAPGVTGLVRCDDTNWYLEASSAGGGTDAWDAASDTFDDSAGVSALQPHDTGVQLIGWAEARLNPIIGQADRTGDNAANNLLLSGQYASLTATGGNVIGGALEKLSGGGTARDGSDDGPATTGTAFGMKTKWGPYKQTFTDNIAANEGLADTSNFRRARAISPSAKSCVTEDLQEIINGAGDLGTIGEIFLSDGYSNPPKVVKLVATVVAYKGTTNRAGFVIQQLYYFDGTHWNEDGTAGGDISNTYGSGLTPVLTIADNTTGDIHLNITALASGWDYSVLFQLHALI